MSATDTSEKGLETLIVERLTQGGRASAEAGNGIFCTRCMWIRFFPASRRCRPFPGSTGRIRNEVKATMKLTLPDADAEIEPVPTSGGGHKPEPELDHLSNILKSFNELFGNIDWKDTDRIGKVITEEIPAKVAANKAYQNAMKNSDKQAARLEHDKVLGKVIVDYVADHTELYKQFFENPSFKKWLADTVFGMTYEKSRPEAGGSPL